MQLVGHVGRISWTLHVRNDVIFRMFRPFSSQTLGLWSYILYIMMKLRFRALKWYLKLECAFEYFARAIMIQCGKRSNTENKYIKDAEKVSACLLVY